MKVRKRHMMLFALLLATGLAGCGEAEQRQTAAPSAPPPAQDQANTAADSTAPEAEPP